MVSIQFPWFPFSILIDFKIDEFPKTRQLIVLVLEQKASEQSVGKGSWFPLHRLRKLSQECSKLEPPRNQVVENTRDPVIVGLY